MLEIYEVDEFYPIKNGNYRFEWLLNREVNNVTNKPVNSPKRRNDYENLHT
jgi:hypothetical protein